MKWVTVCLCVHVCAHFPCRVLSLLFYFNKLTPMEEDESKARDLASSSSFSCLPPPPSPPLPPPLSLCAQAGWAAMFQEAERESERGWESERAREREKERERSRCLLMHLLLQRSSEELRSCSHSWCWCDCSETTTGSDRLGISGCCSLSLSVFLSQCLSPSASVRSLQLH